MNLSEILALTDDQLLDAHAKVRGEIAEEKISRTLSDDELSAKKHLKCQLRDVIAGRQLEPRPKSEDELKLVARTARQQRRQGLDPQPVLVR